MGLLNFLKPKRKVIPLDLNGDNFNKAIKNSQKPVLVDFFSPTCAPCKQMASTFTKFATDFQDQVNVASVDVSLEENEKIVTDYKVRSVPTIIIFNKGKMVELNVGITGYNQLKEMVEKCKS